VSSVAFRRNRTKIPGIYAGGEWKVRNATGTGEFKDEIATVFPFGTPRNNPKSGTRNPQPGKGSLKTPFILDLAEMR
jgi:hypothetical protein